VRTIAVLEEAQAPAFCSRYCNESVVSPDPTNNLIGYRDTLLGLANREDVRTIVPTRDQDAYVLSRYRDMFKERVATPWSNLETLRQAQDRYQLADAAESAGVPVPETKLLSEVTDWSNSRRIVKPRFSVVGDAYVEETPPEECFEPPSTRYLEPGVRPDVESIEAELRHTPIVQEFVPTKYEYVFDALYDNGEALATFQHRQIRANEYHGGASAYRESIAWDRLDELGRRLLDHLEWHGLACIEFMEDAQTGELKLTEINPRLWASLPLTVRAGADFPLYYWMLAMGREERIQPGYDTGVASHHLASEFNYLRSIVRDDHPLVERPSLPRAIRTVLTSMITDPCFDDLDPTDPCPFIRTVLNGSV
jgi:predicted ATP-grasp superfamily ATP-dependent carboligase